MLVLTTIRPVMSQDKLEFSCFNWDSNVPAERQLAAKLIFEAMADNNTVMSRRITYRNSTHATVQTFSEMKRKIAEANAVA